MRVTDVFKWNLEAYNTGTYRIIANRGSTRSSKTYSLLQLIYLIAVQNNLRISIIAESIPHLKRGALRDWNSIIEGENKAGIALIKESDHLYKFTSGSFVEFFSADDNGKLRGSQRDIAFINEANRIDYASYQQISIRTSKCVFLDFNPSAEWWIDNLSDRDDFIEFKSTYKNNNFLSEEQIREIEAGKKDPSWWSIYGLGEYAKSDGLVYKEYETFKEEPETGLTFWGLDYGFKDPTALVKVKMVDDSLFITELLYEPLLSGSEVVKKVSELVPKNATLICDSARPEITAEIRKKGIKALPAKKGAGSILEGIQLVKGYKLFIKGKNLKKELDNYSWEENLDGSFSERPLDKNNHLLDALRYVVLYNKPSGTYKIKTI